MPALPATRRVVAIALLSLSAGAFAAGHTKHPARPASDLKALEAVDQAWLKAFNSADGEAMGRLYDEQAVLLPPGAPATQGRAAIKTLLAQQSAEMQKAGLVFSLGANPAGGVSGKMGWQSGSYAVRDKGGKVLETGKYLSVSVKKGGHWLYLRDTWNADSAPPPADAPKN